MPRFTLVQCLAIEMVPQRAGILKIRLLKFPAAFDESASVPIVCFYNNVGDDSLVLF